MSLFRSGASRPVLFLSLIFLALITLLFSRSAAVIATDYEYAETVVVRMSPAEWQSFDQTPPPVNLIDYDAYLWVELELADFSRLQASGADFSYQTNPFHLTLGEQTFDPLRSLPQLPAGWDSPAGGGPDFHLVQLNGPTRNDWLAELTAQNLEIVQYIHPYTYIVWGENVNQRVQNLDFVRWSGPFVAAYKVLPHWQNLPADILPVDILLYRGADIEGAAQQLDQIGRVYGRAVLNAAWEVVGVNLNGDQLQTAAHIPGVYSIQPLPTDGGLRGEMSNQINANNHDENNQAFPGYAAWLAGVGLDGSGVIMANVDSGVQANHPDLINRMLPCSGSTCSTSGSNHGTHTAAIMAADGSSGVVDSFGFLRGQGVAPGANLVAQVYSSYNQPGGMLYLMTESHRNGAVLSGNSWGPSGTPQGYDNHTMQVDIGVRDADPDEPGNQAFTYVLSIMNGNGGHSSQGSPDEAKNIFTIGSTKMQNPNGSQILDINDLSSNTAHGPALDGRKIPHMVAPGCRVDSAITGSSYGLMCGTSMASPHVSGAVGLFVEYYRNLHGVDPTPAMIKAAFLPVAHNLAGYLDADGNTLGHPFDSKQGWGRMDLEAVIDPQVEAQYFDDPFLFLETGEEWEQQVLVVDPSQPLRVMLVWTDAPGHGMGGSTPAWNNDLDLVVEMGGQMYLGNQFGSDGWSVPGGSADYRNNTEGVFIAPGAGSAATIRVVAANLTSEAVPGNGHDIDQDFALVCYNCMLSPFNLSAEPPSLAVCVPDADDAVYEILVGAIPGYDDAVTLSVSGEPAGTTTDFSQNPVTPPGSSQLTIGNLGAAEAGSYTLLVSGEAVTDTHAIDVGLALFTEAPGQPTLLTPPHAATNQPQRPTFTWEAAAQGHSYTLEIATDSAFNDIVYAVSGLTETNYDLPIDLMTSTRYYWRVAAENSCGDGAYSAVFHFTTLAAPGDCGPGSSPVTHFFDDFESGAPGWTSGGVNDTWALSNARQHSGDWSYHAENLSTVSDQQLVSPPVTLPADESPLTLQFWNYQYIESRSLGGCWDGAILEVSTDDGATWEYVEGDKLLTDPYDGEIQSGYSNPLAGYDGWCGDPQDWLNSIVNIDDYAGETVRFRFRLGTDSVIGREGWYIDDVRVQSCAVAYNAYLTPESNIESMPATVVEHTFTLENLGLDDSYTLSLAGYEWATTLLSADELDLAYGETAAITVQVTLPGLEGQPLAGSDSFTLTAQSAADADLTLTAAGTTSYTVTPGVATSGDDEQAGVYGQTLLYTIAITNTGNYTDAFTVEIGESNWLTSSNVAEVGPLAPGASATVEISVTVGHGQSDSVAIRFISSLDSDVWAEAVLSSGTRLIFLPLITK